MDPEKQKSNFVLNGIDLFCGCGGMTEGLKHSINIICGIDIWDKAIESYKKNHKHLALYKDLIEFPPEELDKMLNKKIDIIVGGTTLSGI